MEFIQSLDEWGKLLFLSICVLFLFIAFFKMRLISELLTEGLMNMG